MKINFMAQWRHGKLLRDALRQAGHEIHMTNLHAEDSGDVLFTDDDCVAGYKALCDRHQRVFLHPHGGGIVRARAVPHPHVRGRFENGQGQIDILRRHGFQKPAETIGWTFCETGMFRATTNPIKVLFAPAHVSCLTPNDDPFGAENRRIFAMLAALPVDLTFRYVLDYQTAWYGPHLPHVHYIQGSGRADDAAAGVEGFDCVISCAWTFPCISVARGIPTLTYCQDGFTPEPMPHRCPREGWSDPDAYPYDASTCETPAELWAMIQQACATEATAWKGRFIGKPFDPQDFMQKFNHALENW